MGYGTGALWDLSDMPTGPITAYVIQATDCMPQFVPKMFYGVAVGRLRSLFHLCDALVLDKGSENAYMMRHSAIILIREVVLEMLPDI